MRLPDPGSTAARRWYTTVAFVLAAGLLLRLGLMLDESSPGFGTRLVRLFSYFTIQSNIVLLVVTIALARDPLEARPFWRVARLYSTMAIVVTGLIYYTLLLPNDHASGLYVVATAELHFFAPIAGVVGWALFGPWPAHEVADIAWGMCVPVAYIVWTLIHGAASDWYPYGFLNVDIHGYVGVGVRAILIGALMATLLATFAALDDRWSGARRVAVA